LGNYGEKNIFLCKSAQKVLNNPIQIQTQKYAIGFYNDAIKQFENVGRERSKVTESLEELKKIVKILEHSEIIDNKIKDELTDRIESLDKNNPI